MPAPLLEVIDDLASPELFAEAAKTGAAKGWYFGHGSHETDHGRFWKFDLDGIVVYDQIWQQARERCEQLAGAPLRVLRQYANGHTYGLGGQPHVDDTRPGTYTLLYYPMAEWPDGWDGETVFYDEHGEIALSVRPRPNRAILFDSRIPHAGRAPSRQCPALRVTAAYKLLVAAAASEEPAELSLEGAVRHHRVAVPEERLAKLVSEHLEKLATTVRLPGFRPGKIPLELIAQRYGAAARAEAVKHLAAEAVFSLGKDAMIVSVETSELAGKIEIQIVAVHLADLPQPPSGVILERLTASQAQLDAAGLEPGALDAHWREQMMDRLDEAYRFPLPAGLVESERAAVEQAIGGPPAESEAVREVQRIAERRVRLGIVVSELARRLGIAGGNPEMQVLQHLLAQAEVRERPATEEELRELA